MKDKNGLNIEIGDIVKIENSPIKSDNATYIVAQDGTSKNYLGSDLTLYKVAKHKDGYSLSRSSYNICFYPLRNFSNKYHYTREEMDAATIEIILKADNKAFSLVKNDDNYENEETEQTYFRAVVKIDDKEIEDTSYPASQKEKLIAFFSNITLKDGETIEIIKQNHTWGYYYKNISYRLESTKQVEETAQEESKQQIETMTEIANNNLHYDITEDTDTRDNSTIYVVKVIEKLDRDDYIKVNNYIKSIGGYYSKFKRGFIFKDNPTELLTNSNNIKYETNTEKQEEIKQIEQSQINQKPSIEFDIEQSEHTKTKEIIWLVKPRNSLTKSDFAEVKQKFATLKGFYSSFNNSFIFKYDPTEKLKDTA